MALSKEKQKEYREKNKEKASIEQKKWRDKNPHAQTRKKYIEQVYGITYEEYYRLRELAIFCTICGDELNLIQRHPCQKVLDHDHETGQVRGFICSKCNKGIGCLKEDITILESAIKWLTK